MMSKHHIRRYRYNIIDTRTGVTVKSVIAASEAEAGTYAIGLSSTPVEFIELRQMGMVDPCCKDCGKPGAKPCGDKKHE